MNAPASSLSVINMAVHSNKGKRYQKCLPGEKFTLFFLFDKKKTKLIWDIFVTSQFSNIEKLISIEVKFLQWVYDHEEKSYPVMVTHDHDILTLDHPSCIYIYILTYSMRELTVCEHYIPLIPYI